MDYRNRPIRGIQDGEGIAPHKARRDIRPTAVKIFEILRDREHALILMAIGPILMFWDSGFWLGGFTWSSIIYFCHNYLKKGDSLPLRLPQTANCPDPNSPAPGGKKLSQAGGIYFLGNEKKTNQELWLEQKDILTHFLLFGTTGSGKTETLVSLSYNALALGSGLIYVDPKGTSKLAHQIHNMARNLGRDDDFLILNFGVQGKDGSHKLSNTCNPFSFGSAEILTEMLASLMASSDGKNQVFQAKGQAIIAALMYALVDLRDKGKLVISPRVIRDYLDSQKFIELSEDMRLSQFSRDAMEAALSTCNYTKDMPIAKQKSFHEQFGYGRAYFGQALSSLADTYGHIFDVETGEIDFRDVVMNRRILVVLLPSMEKSTVELGNLGKIVLSCLKAAASTGLGMRIEGSPEDVLGSLPIHFQGTGPFLTIVDEYAAITTPGFEILLTQGRGLGMATIVASQDYAGMVEADKKGSQQISANTNTKVFMRMQDAEKTFELIKGLTGMELVSTTDGWNYDDDGYRDNFKASIERQSRIDIRDLMEQTEGEAHLIWNGQLVRANMFYVNPDLKSLVKISRKIQMKPMEEK